MIDSLIEAASIATALAGILVFFVYGARDENWIAAIPLTLDFWTASTFLSLAHEVTWTRLATTAAIVVIPMLTLWGRKIPS